MITKLEKKILNNVAPITLADAVYIGDGSNDTISDVLNLNEKGKYSIKTKQDAAGLLYKGTAITFLLPFGNHNLDRQTDASISLNFKLKVTSNVNCSVSWYVHATNLGGCVYTTNMSSFFGSDTNTLATKNEWVEFSYTGNKDISSKHDFALIIKTNKVDENNNFNFEIKDFEFKINDKNMLFLESKPYMPNGFISFEYTENFKYRAIELNKEQKLSEIGSDILYSSASNQKTIYLWGDSITAGDKATSNDLCYASLLKSYLENYYSCTVTNKGVSGRFLGQWKGDLLSIPNTVDILFIQIGTNDTSTISMDNLRAYYTSLKNCVDTFIKRGIKVVLMSATPCSPSWDQRGGCHFEVVNQIIKSVANDCNLEHLSNFDDMLNYCEYKDIDYNTYLFDGVHPNDNGYAWIYKNIVKRLGLQKVPDATW